MAQGDSLPHQFFVFVNGTQITDIPFNDTGVTLSYPNQTSEIQSNVYNTNVYHAITNNTIVEITITVVQGSESDKYLEGLLKRYFNNAEKVRINYKNENTGEKGAILDAGFTGKPDSVQGTGMKTREYTLQGRGA